MSTPGADPPIRSLGDARACVGAGFAALGAAVDWFAQLGHGVLAGDLRRRTQDIAMDFADGLDQVRDAHPELDDDSEPDEDDEELP